MAVNSTGYQCPFCLSYYSRQEHLQRHLASHTSIRPFNCDFCTNSFRRVDVLQRHLRSCKQRILQGASLRSSIDLISNSRKKRACDRCVRQKRACSLEVPCEGCRVRDQPCNYLRARPVSRPIFTETVHGNADDTQANTVARRVRYNAGDGNNPRLPSEHDTTVARNQNSQDISCPGPSESVMEIGIHQEYQISSVNILPDPARNNFTFSSLTWEDFCVFGDERIRSQHDLLPRDIHDPIGSFRLEFLANFTSTTGFVSSFLCGTLDQRQDVIQTLESAEVNSGISRIEDTPLSQFSDEHVDTEEDLQVWGYILTDQCPTEHQTVESQIDRQISPHFTQNWMQAPISIPNCFSGIASSEACRNLKVDLPHHQQWLPDRLALKTYQIVSQIKELVLLKPRHSVVAFSWSSFLEEICLQFFSPPNLRKLMGIYWACWHPNWPVIHKPTFSLISVHPSLLAAIVLIGACISPDGEDIENARTWFDIVEEMAFSDKVFLDNSMAGSSSRSTFEPCTNRQKIQALQAAYAVCLYQNWEGPDTSKRRIRRDRYSTVVAVARDIGLGNAKHDFEQSNSFLLFDWDKFAVREEYIRTLLYIFLLDTAFVMFNNLPPRMVVKELRMDLACPEPCFQALTSDDCLQSITVWKCIEKSPTKMSLCAALETICKKDMDRATCKTFADLGVLNLFTLTSAFHSLIFHHHTSFCFELQLAPIRNALANWKEIWLLRAVSGDSETRQTTFTNPDPSNMWKRVGFMQNAPEFWLLAKIVLDRLESVQNDGESAVSDETGDGSHSHSLNFSPSVFDKYDETSMRQVNEIITNFQRLNVGCQDS